MAFPEDCSSKGIALVTNGAGCTVKTVPTDVIVDADLICAELRLCRYKRGPGIFREDYLGVKVDSMTLYAIQG